MKPRAKRTGLTVALLVAFALGAIAVIRPVWQWVHASRSESARLRELIVRERALIDSGEFLLRQRGATERELESLSNVLLAARGPSEAVAQLADLVRSAAAGMNGQLPRVDPSSPVREGALVKASVRVEGEADLPTLIYLLEQLESDGVLLVVTDLAVRDRSGTGTRGSWLSYRFTVSGYFRPHAA